MITVVSTPTRTIGGITSNVVAARAQALFQFSTDLAAEENYKINIMILDENDDVLISTIFKYSVKVDGTVNVDLGRVVTEINESRGALSTRFKINYFETYTGNVGPETIIGEWLAVYGEKQILSTGGANMYEYLLNDPTSKQATPFDKPVFWEFFDRAISVVIDSDFQARTGLTQYRVKSVQYDINKLPISTEYSNYITDLTPRLDLNLISGAAPYIGVSIDGLTEEIIHERRHVCDNPIMIDWLNSYGGVEQWMFEVDQIYDRDAGQGISYQSAISGDISTVNRTKHRQSPKWIQQIIVKAENLTLDQLKALQEIKSSISVRAQLDNSGMEWVGVVCSGKFSTIHNSGDDRHEFTMQIEFPDNFDFNEAVEYNLEPIDPDVAHVLSRMFSPSELEETAITNFILAEKAVGNYQLYDEFYCHSLGAVNGVIGFKNKTGVSVGGVTFDVNGATFNGTTGYINTNFNQLDDAIVSSQNNIGRQSFVKDFPSPVYDFAQIYEGLAVFYNTVFDSGHLSGVTNVAGKLRAEAGGTSSTEFNNQNAPSLYGAVRVSQTQNEAYVNGVLAASVFSPSQVLVNSPYYIGAINSFDVTLDTSSPANFTEITISTYTLHGAIGFDSVAHNTNVRALLTELGVVL